VPATIDGGKAAALGSLVNTSRSLAAGAYPGQPAQYPTPFINCVIALAYTLKHQLRETDPDTESTGSYPRLAAR